MASLLQIGGMVAPSCCLEYRPTAHFWLIILFIIFPTIYLCGKVVGCFVTVLLRVLRGICRFILWDEADYEEEDRRMAEEKGAEARKLLEEREARREEARARRREERRRLREEAKEELRQLLAQTNGKPKVTNGVSKQTVIREEPRQSSDNSDSLISECEDENSQATSGIVVSESRPRKADHLKSAH